MATIGHLRVNFYSNKKSDSSLLEQRKTSNSAITERPRCRVCYSFGQKWKTGTGRQYFTDIIGLSSTIVI